METQINRTLKYHYTYKGYISIKTKTIAKLNSTEMDFGEFRLEFKEGTKLGIQLLNKTLT